MYVSEPPGIPSEGCGEVDDGTVLIDERVLNGTPH
jgi:hypothetical protein